jgi:ribonuclease D
MNLFPSNISIEELNQLPIIRFEGKIIVVDSLHLFYDSIKQLNNKSMIGFDTETRPSFKKGKSNKVSLIQLATEDTCYLFRIHLIGLQQELINLLSNPSILKIGLSIKDDIRAINKIKTFVPAGFIDLQDYVKSLGIEEKSLKKITGLVMHARISKSQQISNWEIKEFSEAQKIYAATDAWICLKIYNKINQLLNLQQENKI